MSLLYTMTSHPLFHSLLTLFSLLPDLLCLLKFYMSRSFIFLPIPRRLSIFTPCVAVISSWRRFNPASAQRTLPPFLTSLYIAPPFHLDIYVSVGLSILLRPGSKVKWFSGSHWNLIEFERENAMKKNLWWTDWNTLKESPGYDGAGGEGEAGFWGEKWWKRDGYKKYEWRGGKITPQKKVEIKEAVVETGLIV